jgi:radical SAM superfamily enzyme YgiQ (UPF0313 family)
MPPRLLLVNANEMRPAVAPLGLEYVASAAEAAGLEVGLLDLTWADDPEAAIAAALRQRPVLVGLTLRNTDDCYMASRHSCLPHARSALEALRRHTDAPLVLGGCGYSVMPAALLGELGADYGIAGDGEEALPRLAHALAAGEDPSAIPGLVYRADGGVRRNPPRPADLSALPPARRAFLDNARYWREGGQGGFETKRGCDRACIYCADPIAKGRRARLRNPCDVADEAASLAAQGVVHLHTCDAEFNVPRDHALAVCDALIERGLAERVRWWAYCAPAGFDDDLAARMQAAGCAGVDFGADHGCDDQLARLGRDHRAADLVRVAGVCRRRGIVFMYDLLFGAPGDTRDAIRRTLELMQRLEPTRVGISAGVRVYPGTPLARQVIRGPLAQQPGLCGDLEGNDSLTRPVFYVAPEVGDDIAALIAEVVGGDRRFLCPDPAAGLADYNYTENTTLVDAIRAGHRGAYWDILRCLQEGLPPV